MSRDLELYNKWKVSRSPQDMEDLIKEFKGTIHKATIRFSSGNVPTESLDIKARQLTAEAIRTYDKNSGTNLNSWVTTNLNKLYRFYTQHNITHVSEDMFSLQNNYFKQKTLLEDTLDRPATLTELADNLGVPEKKILTLEKTFSPHFQDSSINTNKYVGFGDTLDETELTYMFDQLTEYEQRLFKMKTGWPGGKAKNLSYIEQKTGKSKATLSREFNQLADKLKLMLRI